MAEPLKKITLDGTELEICDDTARSTANSNLTQINTNTHDIANLTTDVNSIKAKNDANTTNITNLTADVNNLKKKSSVNITYNSSSSGLVITHN